VSYSPWCNSRSVLVIRLSAFVRIGPDVTISGKTSMKRLLVISLGPALVIALSAVINAQQEQSFDELVSSCESASRAEVFVTPLLSSLRYVRRKTLNGPQRVVSIPIQIKNGRSTSITSQLNHEWPGGIWLPNDLIVRARNTGKKSVWVDVPGYLTGEKDSQNYVNFASGQQRRFSVRLNWPGTGSMPMIHPLIPESGIYFVQFLFRFMDDTSKSHCVTSKVERIRVSK
jgi:hypothetical protein